MFGVVVKIPINSLANVPELPKLSSKFFLEEFKNSCFGRILEHSIASVFDDPKFHIGQTSDLVKNLLPVPLSRENMPPMPGTQSIIRLVFLHLSCWSRPM